MSTVSKSVFESQNLNIPFFRLEDDEQSKSFDQYKRGRHIFKCNEEAHHVYMVVKGVVKIYNYTEQGQEVVRSILTDGEIFGLEAISSASNDYQAHAISQEDSTIIYELSLASFIKLMNSDANLGLKLLQMLSKRISDAEAEKDILKLKGARDRLKNFITNMAIKNGKKVGFEIMFECRLTHAEIGGLIGLSRQTVTSFLNEMRKDNLINFNRRRFLIRDMETFL